MYRLGMITGQSLYGTGTANFDHLLIMKAKMATSPGVNKTKYYHRNTPCMYIKLYIPISIEFHPWS